MPRPLPARHYPKAPITEAVIDIRVELPPEVSLATLAEVQVGEESRYPSKASVINEQVQIAAGLGASVSREELGLVFRSDDEKYIFQARRDGFTMSRLAPYEDWETFRTESRRIWNRYRAVAKPAKIVRLAVRYINRIDIPLPVSEFGDYLRTLPEISRDMPQGLAGYFMQLNLPMDDIDSTAVINETITEPARPGVVSIVLDIDIFRSVDVPSDEDEIWAFMDQLRTAKNQTFEASITDKARELFQ
jgi:uncharacterized protein (TIGR04255 family)